MHGVIVKFTDMINMKPTYLLTPMNNIYLFSILCLLLTGCKAMPSYAESARRMQLDVPMALITPMLTATLDDKAWEQASIIHSLSACEGTNEPGEQTRVQLLWDATYLYVRLTCQNRHVFAPYGNERDELHYQGDVVEVYIDPQGDGRQYVEVQVNPMGGILDVIHFATTKHMPSSTPVLPRQQWPTEHWGITQWNMQGLRTAVSMQHMDDQTRWITDIALPAKTLLKRLGVETFSPMTLRANFLRYDGPVDMEAQKRSKLIATCWAQVPTGLPHLAPGTMGYLHLVAPSVK